MKILLIGATGMVGSRILEEALARDHLVVGTSRNSETHSSHENLESIKLDVNRVEDVVNQAKNCDLIISAVSPRNSGDAISDAEMFTKSLIEVVNRTEKRLLMVGGGSSLNMPDGRNCLELTPDQILPEATGMRRAYALLGTADIDFAVLAPGGAIEPGERTESFRLAGRTMLVDDQGNKSRISAEDYSIAMLDEAENPKHFRTIFNVAY